MAARIGIALLVVVAAVGVRPADGQEGWYVTPSLSLSADFDDNIFSTTSDRTADVVTRVTPGLALSYVSGLLTASGRYSLTGEVYADNSDLSGIPNAQSGGLEAELRPNQVLTLGLSAVFTRSETTTPQLLSPVGATTPLPTAPPGGAPPATGVPPGTGTAGGVGAPAPGTPSIDRGQEASTTLGGGPRLTYLFGPRTTGDVAYTYLRTETGEQPADTEHDIEVGFRHQLTRLDRPGLRYDFRRFEGALPETSHTVTAEWDRRFTERTGAYVGIGPRFSDAEGGVGVDASAGLTHRFEHATASLTYRRTQELVTGRTGAQITDGVAAGVSVDLGRSLTGDVRGLYLHASNEGPTSNTVETYAARVSLAYQITEWVLARVAYGFYLQNQDTGDISHHTVSIGLDFSQRFRVR